MKTQDKETPSKIIEPTSLKEARGRQNKKQMAIAEEVGMQQSSICRIEIKRGAIPNNKLGQFAKAYGVSVEQLKKLTNVRTPLRGQRFNVDDGTNILPVIKAITKCGLFQLTRSELSRLLDSTSRFKKCTPGLIKEILACGFK